MLKERQIWVQKNQELQRYVIDVQSIQFLTEICIFETNLFEYFCFDNKKLLVAVW